MSPDLEAVYLSAQEAVQKQADNVRALKASLKEGKAQKVRVIVSHDGAPPTCGA
jgi:hypothetical protein